MTKLKRDLKLIDLVFYGMGIIFGAGIYVLVGHVASFSGNGVWLSFIIAAVIASFTGLSYAELSSMYPKDAAEYTYVKKAFRNTTAGFIIGWLTFFTMTIAAAVVSLGFGQYLQGFTGFNPVVSAACLLIIFGFVNYLGIKMSSKLNIFLTAFAVIGLLIIIYVGIPFIGSVNYFDIQGGIFGIFGGAAVAFFAYLGFDEIVNVAEETKDAKKNIPKAIIISVAITKVVYILVSLAAVSVVPWQELGASSTPLALVASNAFGASAGSILGIFALFATSSTVLILLIAGSRMLFGLAEDHVMPRFFIKTGKRKTPYFCILIITVVALASVLYGEIKSIALLVDFGAFFTFALINLSAIVLRFTEPKTKRQFRIPLSIGRLPLLPTAGFLISSYMLLQFEINLVWISVIIMISGYIFYKFLEASKIKK